MTLNAKAWNGLTWSAVIALFLLVIVGKSASVPYSTSVIVSAALYTVVLFFTGFVGIYAAKWLGYSVIAINWLFVALISGMTLNVALELGPWSTLVGASSFAVFVARAFAHSPARRKTFFSDATIFTTLLVVSTGVFWTAVHLG